MHLHPPSRRVPAARHRRLAVLLVGLALTSALLTGCDRARVGQRCKGSGWAEDGGAWILRCTKGRFVRVLTKAQYVQLLLASQPATGSTPSTPSAPSSAGPATSPTTTTTTTPPVPLSATQITGGFDHTCARISNGTLRCWGSGFFGQLGNGRNDNVGRATDVIGIPDATAVAAGGGFTCAIRVGGSVWCWGDNKGGELGDGTSANVNVPAQLAGVSGAGSVDAGFGHACATVSGGQVMCWGANGADQLGAGAASAAFNLPSLVPGLGNVVQVSTGGAQSCALRSDGTVACWGSNVYGELGASTPGLTSATPVAVSGLNNVAAISAGRRHTCARRNDGTVACWGEGVHGQLGNGAASSSTTPVQVSGLTDAISVSAGTKHTCALRTGGSVVCWGANDDGQLGTGNVVPSAAPVAVVQLSGADAMSVGDFHSCAHLSDNSVRCWGGNGTGQLGNLSTENASGPQLVVT